MANTTRYYITDNRTPNSAFAVSIGHPHPYLAIGCNTRESGGAVEWVEFPISASEFTNVDEASGVLMMLPLGCQLFYRCFASKTAAFQTDDGSTGAEAGASQSGGNQR